MDQAEREERTKLVAIARSFVGTPYVDCGLLKGIGVDCGTFLKLAYEEAGLESEIDVGKYSPQWFLHQDGEHYLGIIERFCSEIAAVDAQPADIVVYKMGRSFAHGAIILTPGWPEIVHAHKQSGCVVLGDGARGPLAKNRFGHRPRRFFRRKAWRG